MEISLALMADLANVDGGGKLNILGVFGQINPPSMPWDHPLLFLVMNLEVPRSEFGIERSLDGVLMDEDGEEILRVGPVKVLVDREQARKQSFVDVPLVFQIANLKLKKRCTYGWHINVDNDHKRTVRLVVGPQQ